MHFPKNYRMNVMELQVPDPYSMDINDRTNRFYFILLYFLLLLTELGNKNVYNGKK